MPPKKHLICFIDDDPEELRRCQENLKTDFAVAIGTSISQAIEDPSESELRAESLSPAYDLSFETNKQHVIRDIEEAVIVSTWWWKHKEGVLAYIAGFVSYLV